MVVSINIVYLLELKWVIRSWFQGSNIQIILRFLLLGPLNINRQYYISTDLTLERSDFYWLMWLYKESANFLRKNMSIMSNTVVCCLADLLCKHNKWPKSSYAPKKFSSFLAEGFNAPSGKTPDYKTLPVIPKTPIEHKWKVLKCKPVQIWQLVIT